MTFETLVKYTEESNKCAREFQKFLQLKAQLDADYAQKIMKLCQTTYHSFKPSSSSSSPAGAAAVSSSTGSNGLIAGALDLSMSGSGSASAGASTSSGIIKVSGTGSTKNLTQERQQLLQTSLWQTFAKLLHSTHATYAQLKKTSTDLDTTVTVPLSLFVKDTESIRKQLQDKSVSLTNELQEFYVVLKKSKQAHNDAVSAYTDARDAHQKALLKSPSSSSISSTATGNIASSAGANLSSAQASGSGGAISSQAPAPTKMDRELEKLVHRLQIAKDRLDAATTNYKHHESLTSQAQMTYWQQSMPALVQAMYGKEEELATWVHESMKRWIQLDRLFADDSVNGKMREEEVVDEVDLTGDMEEVFTEHVSGGVGVVGKQDDAVSVRSLLNPLKAGRLLKKADENDATWKGRYFVLMGDRSAPMSSSYQPSSGRLYYFDSEDSLKPKGILDFSSSMIMAVHDSLFPGKQNVFVIVLSEQQANTIGGDKVDAELIKVRTFYLSAESAEEKLNWISILKRYTLCCFPCTAKTLAEPLVLSLDKTEMVTSHFPNPHQRESSYRRIRSVRISIQDGRDLNLLDPMDSSNGSDQLTGGELLKNLVHQRYNYQTAPYCVIAVKDATRIAQTASKIANSPFWGEEFYFDSLPECVHEFRITVHSASTRHKELEMGFVEVKLKSIFANAEPSEMLNSGNKKWEGWLNVTPAGDSHGSGSSALRIVVSYSAEAILPLHEYPCMINRLYGNEFRILKTISVSSSKCTNFARDDFAKSLVSVITSTQVDLAALKALLSVDLESIDDPNIIFRGNTLTTKTLDQYMKFVGMDFLKLTLSAAVKLVHDKAAKQELCEVDPTRIEDCTDEIIRKNQKRLLNLVQTFWNAIQSSVDKAPVKLRSAMNAIRESVVDRFPNSGNDNLHYAAISGFLFLRFFCPAILNPKLFGIWPEMPDSPTTSRTFTLIAKIMQNLANLTDFKSKEPFMEFVNGWIALNVDSMKYFIDSFMEVPEFDLTLDSRHSLFISSESKVVDLSRELNNLYVYLKSNLQDLTSLSEFQNNASADVSRKVSVVQHLSHLPKLFEFLDQISAMYKIYSQNSDQTIGQMHGLNHLRERFPHYDVQDSNTISSRPKYISRVTSRLGSINRASVSSAVGFQSNQSISRPSEEQSNIRNSNPTLFEAESMDWGEDLANILPELKTTTRQPDTMRNPSVSSQRPMDPRIATLISSSSLPAKKKDSSDTLFNESANSSTIPRHYYVEDEDEEQPPIPPPKSPSNIVRPSSSESNDISNETLHYHQTKIPDETLQNRIQKTPTSPNALRPPSRQRNQK